MTNFVISTSQGGLSNRIKCLMSSMKIADKTNRKLLLFWPKDKSCNCNFKDLFENKIKEVSKEDLRKIIITKNYEIYQNSLENLKNKKRFILIDSARFIGFSEKDILFRFNELPKEIKDSIFKHLKNIKIKENILKKVDGFLSKFNKEVIGIHIRKGDFKILKNDIGKISNEDLFIEKMKKELEENSKTNFFLATEDEETEKKFKGIFKSKIITYPKKTKERGEEGAVIEALIELLLLSKTKKIYGTFGSTFSELASLFGRNELEIIIDKDEFRKFTKRVKKEEKNLITKIKKFIYEITYPKKKRFFRVVVK